MTPVLSAYLGGLVPVLGWTLAHFLWQGALVALVLQMLLRTCRTARARHDLALAALVLMAILPVATFAWLKGDVRVMIVPAGFLGLHARHEATWETAVVLAWLTGVAVLAIRMIGGLLLIERLRRTATPLPPAWAARCRTLQARMAGRLTVIFAQSEAVAAPLVAGWLRPIVLIPAMAITRLPADQLEALILHELAHVRRRDAIANLIQSVVEIVLFYHPAVWWVSRRIRIEREHCCDDLAVGAVGDPALYVRALQAIDRVRTAPSGVLASNGGDLKRRAARILGLAVAPARPALSRTAAILTLAATALAMTHSAAVEARPAAAAATRPVFSPSTAAIAASAEALPTTVTPAPASPAEPPRLVLAVASPLALISAPPLALPPPEASPPPTPSFPPAPAAAFRLASLNSVTPLVVTSRGKPGAPDLTIQMRGSETDISQGAVVWPRSAYQRRLDGQVTLRCKTDIHGLAERCDVASESPAGKGFADAALMLRPTFKLTPATEADGPQGAMRTVSVNFKAPEARIEMPPPHTPLPGEPRAPVETFGLYENALPMRDITMLASPVWAKAPSFDDLAQAYPAKGGDVEGYAVAHCAVRRSGDLDGCHLIKETPEHRDFGRAALGLAAKFKVIPQLAQKRHSGELWVDVPIRMPPPGDLADRTITAPTWLTGVDPRGTPKLFPPEAAASGLTTGRGVARCVVGPDGALTECAPEAAEPAGLGFSDAAVRLASMMRMNLWSADGGAVQGGVVHVPVRLNLKGG